MRDCYMPQAQIGDGTDLWVSENGYPTNLGRTEASQATDLATTLEAVHAYSGELGITDYRYFNLRDNTSTGPTCSPPSACCATTTSPSPPSTSSAPRSPPPAAHPSARDGLFQGGRPP